MKDINNYIIEKLRLSKTNNLNMSDEEIFKNKHHVEIEKEKQDKLFITRISMDCNWVNKIKYKDFNYFIESFKNDYKYDMLVSINRRYNGENSIDIHIYDDKKFVGQIIIWSERITLNFAPNDEIEHIIYALLDKAIDKYSKKFKS